LAKLDVPDDAAAIRRGPNKAVIAIAAVLLLIVGAGVTWKVAFGSEPDPAPQPPPPDPMENLKTPPLVLTTPNGTPAPPQPPDPPKPTSHPVKVTSTPPGALVWEKKAGKLGATPITLELPLDPTELRFTLGGYEPAAKKVAPEDESVAVTLKVRKKQTVNDNPYGKVEDLKADPFQ
jgi:hypothetical protein